LEPGTTDTITLQKGQIYQVLGANLGADANGNGGTSADGYELTGTRIRSLNPGKKIAVFSGSSRTRNPPSCGSTGGDNDMAQLFPLHIWGQQYLTAPLSASTSASILGTNSFKVLVNDPLTVVKRNGTVLTGLISNSYYLYESNTPDFIEADKPIMLAQFMTTGTCTPGTGDPDMYYLSPLEAGVPEVNCVRTSREGITVNYLTIIIPTPGLNTLLIDGSNVFDHSYAHPAMAGYTIVVKRWASAVTQFNVESDSTFTGVTYGMGPIESYGYNIGANFKPNNGLDPMFPLRWLGVWGGDWFNPFNWSTGRVPSPAEHILIPAGTPYNLSIPDGVTVTCPSLTLEPGATMHVGIGAVVNVTGP
jgi:hypothetical protein